MQRRASGIRLPVGAAFLEEGDHPVGELIEAVRTEMSDDPEAVSRTLLHVASISAATCGGVPTNVWFAVNRGNR